MSIGAHVPVADEVMRRADASDLTATTIAVANRLTVSLPDIGTKVSSPKHGVGVTSGGWGESWAQWMNGGTGGAVCTRTLVYSTAQSRWVVG